MSNSLLTPSVIAKEMLLQFKNGMGFSRNVDKSYSKDFAKKGAKIGSSERIRKPNRFTTTSGANYSAQDVTEDSFTLTIDTQKHVDFEFLSSDLTLTVDDFSERYAKPAALALVNQVDLDGTTKAVKNVANAAGTAGTTPSAILTYLEGIQKIYESAGPQDDMYSYIINPAAQTKIVDALKGLFADQSEISKQYKRGIMGIAAGGEWYMSQNLYAYTSGAQGGTPLTSGTQTEGASTLVTKGWTAAAANRLKAGDVFTIAGINKVNPITKQDTGQLQQFVATADFASDGSGNGSVSISPPLYSSASGSLQNISALPADGTAMTILQGASTVTANNLVMHKSAFSLAYVPLEMPQGVDFSAVETDPDTGISLRLARQWDITSDKFKTRVDVMYGWGIARPEWACKILG
jgi:hypothetical protein